VRFSCQSHIVCSKDVHGRILAAADSQILKSRLADTWWRRPIGCLIFIGHFPQKSPILKSSFAKNDLQLNSKILKGWLAFTGWLRLVGSLKLQVSFAKEPCKRDNILQERTIILRSLLIVATPYMY